LAVILVFGIIAFKNSETGKTFNSKMALKIPLFRNLSVKSATAKFSLTMSTLIMSGVPIVEALGVVANVVENRVIRKILNDAREDVLQGVPMSVPLASAGIFPPMVHQMIKIGEETGTTEKMLDRIADIYEQEVENATKAMTTIMEPCIIVLLAVVVGGVVMAIVMPMMSMYQATGV
jgi:type IV pilus assembly protein PilC